LDIVETEKNCQGGFIAKAKKTGVTQLVSLAFLNESTMIREKRFSMMSKSHEDAKGTNMMLFQHALERLPMILKPRIKNITQSKVIFDKPKANTVTGSMKQMLSAGTDGFKTFVEAVATKEDAFDGPKIWRGWCDEFPKYKSPFPQQVFDKSSEAVKLQQEIYGKIFFTSYPPEDDTQGFFEAKKIYANSSLSTRNALGQTSTGLYKHFVSALNATEGTFNKYGKADQAKAFYLNDTDRKSSEHDRRALQRKKRQYPRNEKECWESGGSGSTFDNIRLSQRLTVIEEEANAGATHFREANIDWTNGFLSTVVITDITAEEKAQGKDGNWRFYKTLRPEELNVPFRQDLRDHLGNFTPDENTIACGAVDPTDYKEKKDVAQGSKNSIHVGLAEDTIRNTAFGEVASNVLFAEYFGRPEDPEELFDEVCKAIMLFGMYIIIEANKGWLVTKIKKVGLQNFLLLKDKKTGVIRPYIEGDELTLINTTDEMINEYCRAIARYLRKPNDGEIDWLDYINSARLIEQLMNFDPMNTKIYDLVVSFGYWRLAVEALAYVKHQREKERGYYSADMMQGIMERIIDL
jgi:hypothetical protein